MKRVLLTAVLIIATGAAMHARPAIDATAEVRAYVETMRATLADIGVRVVNVDSPRDELLVVYAVEDDGPPPEFALATVLRLAEPLADDAQRIRVRNRQGGQRLLELRVRPEEIDSVLASTVDEAQRERIDALVAAALAAVGIEDLQVPGAQEEPEETSAAATARVVRQGAAIIDPVEQTPRPVSRQTPPDESRGPGAARSSVEERAAPATAAAADIGEAAEALFHRLRSADLENVVVGRDARGRWIISFENRTWRSDIDALARALSAAAATLPPSPLIAQIKRHDVVVSHLRLELADYVKLQSGILSPETLAQRWRVSAGTADVAAPVEILARGGESFLRTDLLMRPAIEYHIGLEHDPFVSDLFLVTDAKTTLAPGVSANLRFPAQLTSNQQITMDRALVSWVGRPHDEVLATASAGKFRDNLRGFYGEVRTDWDTHQFGLIGSLVDRDFSLSPTDSNAFGYYQYDWGDLGLKTRLGYGQFLERGEQGLALSLQRRFGESVIETRAVRTDGGSEGLTFELSLPLGPRRAASPATLRPRFDPAFRVNYVSDFNVQGDDLRGPYDLESFRGELSPAYLGAHGERLIEGSVTRADDDAWPVAPSYEGTSGLIRIPTADVANDGRMFTGISYLDRRHAKVRGADTDAMPTFLGFGFLPNLELVGRLTFFHDVQAFTWNYNLDRSLNLHYRLTRQRGDWFPALAVGAQDLMFGTQVSYLGDAEYLVGTWRRDRMRAHLGVGTGKFDPIFAGFEAAIRDGSGLHLMADYDSDYVNAGLRWFIGDQTTASVAVLGLQNVTGSVTFHTDLP